MRGFLDALYPPICLLCGRLSHGTYPHCCQECLDSFEPIGISCCSLCGEPFSSDQTPHQCLVCIRSRSPFRWCRGIYLYRGEVAEALTQLKYRKQLALKAPLEQVLVQGVDTLVTLPAADMLVPVPLSGSGLRKRGFNQSYILSAKLSRQLHLPILAEALKKRGNRKQVGLSARNRDRNASMSFLPGRAIGEVRGKRILLFDDVYTTGATVRACARILKRGGAKEVSVLTLARVEGGKGGARVTTYLRS